MPTYVIEGKRIKAEKPLTDAEIDEIAMSVRPAATPETVVEVTKIGDRQLNRQPDAIPTGRPETSPPEERVGDRVTRYVREVINPVVGPYATAAAAGAAAGAPFAGVGAIPGAAFGVGSLAAGDIAASLYNAGISAVGGNYIRTPSQIIRESYSPEIMGEPTTGPSRAMRTVAEFAVPAQATARSANVLSQLASEGTPIRNILSELARAPQEQTAAALGAGTAVAGTRAMGVESPIIETGAALAGGVTPAALSLGVRTGSRYGYNLIEPVLPGGPERIRGRAYLQAFDNNPMKVQAAIDMLEAGATPQQIALQTNNSNFAALIGSARFANTVVRDMYAARDQLINQRMTDELFRVDAERLAQKTLLETREQELAAAIPAASQRKAGLTIAEQRREMIANRQKTVVTPAYEAAFELAPNSFDFGSVVIAAQKLQADPLTRIDPSLAPKTQEVLSMYKFRPAEEETSVFGSLGGTRQPAKEVPPQVTLRGADALLKAINMDIADLIGVNDAASRTALRNLYKLHNSIDEAIQAGLKTNEPALEAYARAKELYQTQIAQPFREGWVSKLEPRGRTKEMPVAPGNVVAVAMRNEDNAIRFVSAFRDNKTAMDALQNGIIGLYRRAAVKGGRVDPQAHRRFMDQYRQQLQIFDDAGLKVTDTLTEFGKRAKGIEGEKAILNDLVEYSRRAEEKLKDFTPDESAARLNETVREIPELKQVIDQINMAMRDERQFNKLAAEGVRAGGGLKGVVRMNAEDIPSLLSRPAMLANYILSRVRGDLDVKTAAQVAVDLLNSNAAAQALTNALASQRAPVRDYFQRRAVVPPFGPALVSGISTNAMVPVENRNSLRP